MAERESRPARQGPDPVTLIGGLVALALSATAILGNVYALASPHTYVLLAIGAVVVGVVLLVVSAARR